MTRCDPIKTGAASSCEGGFALLEVLITGFLLTVGLLSLSALVFQLQRLNRDTGMEFAAHRVLMNRLAELRQESGRASVYLAKYSGGGVAFTLPREVGDQFPGQTPKGTALARPAFAAGIPQAVVLEVRLDYAGPDGASRSAVAEYLLRCEAP